jgi:hypothetical protein
MIARDQNIRLLRRHQACSRIGISFNRPRADPTRDPSPFRPSASNDVRHAIRCAAGLTIISSGDIGGTARGWRHRDHGAGKPAIFAGDARASASRGARGSAILAGPLPPPSLSLPRRKDGRGHRTATTTLKTFCVRVNEWLDAVRHELTKPSRGPDSPQRFWQASRTEMR